MPKANGKSIIHCVDPQGYEVTLSIEDWENHICKRHPEMASRLEAIKKALLEPSIIQGKSDSDTCFYYRVTGEKFYKFEDFYVCVVVARNETTKCGTVKTAHLLKKIKPSGDRILWITSKLE